MRYLASHFRVLSLAEIIERIRAGRGIEPRTIAVTFDDGYRDNYLYVDLILKKYNLPVTLFAATGFIGTANVMWNDRLAFAVKHTTRQKIALPCELSQESLSLASTPNNLRHLTGSSKP